MGFDDDRLDAFQVQKLGQNKPRGPRADDANLCLHPLTPQDNRTATAVSSFFSLLRRPRTLVRLSKHGGYRGDIKAGIGTRQDVRRPLDAAHGAGTPGPETERPLRV